MPLAGRSTHAPSSAIASDRLAVLLVEDDDGDALIVEDLLEEGALDMRLVRARTLNEGLFQLSAADFDCVLLDLGLPDAIGLETLHRVRARTQRTPVIVLTGLDDEDAGEAAVEAGAQDYLVKGKVDSALLTRAIRYAVGRRHVEEVHQQLLVAEAHAEENSRLERGLAPHPIVKDPSIWIASTYRPGRRSALVGGDFFDAVETADGSLRVIVGDVSGHGPDAAALGAGLRIAWRALTIANAGMDLVLSTLERVIQDECQVPGMFATLCVLEIAPSRRSLRMWRAGHPPPVLVEGHSVASMPLEPGGPPVGVFAGSQWPEASRELPAGWSILLYTDGVIEGSVAHGPERLGEDGLKRLIRDYVEAHPRWSSDPPSLLGHLIERTRELNGEELSDDVAMLLVGSRGVATGGG